jgi:DNA mismatch endonuclease (patch repair protein)
MEYLARMAEEIDADYRAVTSDATADSAAAPDRASRRNAAVSWASSDGVRRSMQSNKGRDTRPELALRSAVHRMGLRYRVSVRPLAKIRRTADLCFTRAKVAVFMDGCFWHGCPIHHTKSKTNADYWADKVVRNRQRDAETDEMLAEAGWTVVRVWEHEHPDAAAQRVSDVVRAASASRTPRRPVNTSSPKA